MGKDDISPFPIYESHQLAQMLRDERSMMPPSSYWLDVAFPKSINFTTEYIDFDQISSIRTMAPMVVPTAGGLPIYATAERLQRVKPAYIKPKDTITATRLFRRQAGLGELASSNIELTPKMRHDFTVVDILRTHRHAIERRWEWMAAEAVINGKISLEGEKYPLKEIDFERNSNHTIDLQTGTRWGDAGVSIIESIESFIKIMREAKLGGVANRLTVGSEVWDVMRRNSEIKELVNNTYRLNSNTNLALGLREAMPMNVEFEHVGKISNSVDVYVYSDYYQSDDGTIVPFMSPKDVVLTSPGVEGLRCFGAIQDIYSRLQSMNIFSRMWNETGDPSATFILSQSAPLMVPVRPNCTLKATVVA